ncbi:MAG: nucleotidyltransferase domain-containing protein [Candidatus Bruticola sp.]
MTEIYELVSASNIAEAKDIIEQLNIIRIWQSIGAEIHLIGSLATTLMCTHLDIDFHVYSEYVSVEDSFLAVSKLASDSHIKQVMFLNLLNTEEACLQWQLIYETESGKKWQIDIVHIKKGSKYDGFFEMQAERIKRALTEEQRQLILKLKYLTPESEKIMGIEYCRAVLEAGVTDYQEFTEYRQLHPVQGILEWMPPTV